MVIGSESTDEFSDRARRRAEKKRGDTLFRPRVTTKSAATKRDPRGASASERSNQTRIARSPVPKVVTNDIKDGDSLSALTTF